MANCIVGLGNLKLNPQISAGVKKATPASALSGFGEVWLSVTGGDTKKVGVVVDEREQKLARAIASDGIAGTGRLLGSSDVNKLRIKSSIFPLELLRKTEACTLLDIAVGSGAVSVSKCLVEFHGAKPTRDTLKMALSSGKIELILERVPKSELDKSRLDLLEVASDFHHETVVAWLFREAESLEKEQFIELSMLALVREARNPKCLSVTLARPFVREARNPKCLSVTVARPFVREARNPKCLSVTLPRPFVREARNPKCSSVTLPRPFRSARPFVTFARPLLTVARTFVREARSPKCPSVNVARPF
jgi:hypothetical protein